tara:strand:- start:1789 stop:5730 length:3942 start_codon:yes stop_codon:yes gene_type:complete
MATDFQNPYKINHIRSRLPEIFEVDENPTWWQDVGSNYKLMYAPVISRIKEGQLFGFEDDPNFNVTSDMFDGSEPFELYEDLIDSKSQKEFDYRKNIYSKMEGIRKELSINNSISAGLFAGVFDPINLIPIPTAVGMGFAKGAARLAMGASAVTGVQEGFRGYNDPLYEPIETVFALGGSTLFGGLLGGTIGHVTRNSGKNFSKATYSDDGADISKETKLITYEPNEKQPIPKKKVEPVNKEDIKVSGDVDYKEVKPIPKNKNDEIDDVVEEVDLKEKTIQEEVAPEKAFGLEFTLKGSIFGRSVTRFKAKRLRDWSVNVAADFGIAFRDSKLGRVITNNTIGGTVNLNKGIWLGQTADYIKFAQNKYLEAVQNIKDPTYITGINIPLQKEKIRQFFTRDGTLKYKDFMDEVGLAIIKGSDSGKIEHEIPQVKEVAQKFLEKMDLAKKSGIEANFFMTGKSLLRRHKQLATEIRSALNIQKGLLRANRKKATGEYKLRLRYNLQRIYTALQSIESLERFQFSKIRNTERTQGRLDDLVEELDAESENAFAEFEKIIKNPESILDIEKDIMKRLKKSHQRNLKVLRELSEEFATRGLTKKQKAYYDILIDRVTSIYKNATPREKAILDEIITFKIGETTVRGSKSRANKLRQLLGKIENPQRLDADSLIANMTRTFEALYTKPVKPTNEKFYFTRHWNTGAIQDNEVLFRGILYNHYLKNPVGRLASIIEDGDKAKIESEINKKVTQTYNRIIADHDNLNVENINGQGLNKFVMHRKLDAPNSLFVGVGPDKINFIDVNADSVMRVYMQRFGPNVEMARMFNGDRFGDSELFQSIDDAIQRYSKEVNKNYNKEANRFANQYDDMRELSYAVMGRMGLGANTGSRSNQVARILQQYAQLTMMGSATLASLADPFKVILSRGLRETFGRYINSWLGDLNGIEKALRKAGEEDLLIVTGEANDPILNTVATRMSDIDSSLGMHGNRKLGKIGDKIADITDRASASFYNVNLLNQWTTGLKRWVSSMSADRIIRTGIAIVDGKPTTKNLKFDEQILLQHGLTRTDLRKIAKVWRANNGERGKKIYYSNVTKWMDQEPELARKYIAAVRADIISTIITPTDADKPLLSYGKFKGSRFGKLLGDRQHTFFKLPIQFMSWSFAANNKILLSTLQGRHKGVMAGVVAMLAAGVASDYIRNRSWWENKSLTEKIIRGIEYSGLTSYWLDINNFVEVASYNNFGIRPLFGQENPFAGETGDALSEPFGPVGSLAYDSYRLFADDELTLDRKASIIRRLIPYNNILYLKWLFKSMENTIVDQIED